MKRRISLSFLSAAVIVLEVLPFGAVLNFADGPEGSLIRETYSYFNLTPFGYANFGPLLTAGLSCALLLLSVLFIFVPKYNLRCVNLIVSGAAFLLSLLPLFGGINSFSVIGIIISLILLSEAVVLFTIKPKDFR